MSGDVLNCERPRLPPGKAAELDAAVASLPFAGIRSFKETPPDGIVKLDIKKLVGEIYSLITS